MESVNASLFKNWRSTLERIEKFISPVYFCEYNLYSRLYPKSQPVDACHCPGSSTTLEEKKLCPSQRPSFKDALKQEFSKKVGVGMQFGPTWATHWIKVDVSIPAEWLGMEIHLRFNAACEALIWSPEGKPLQGLSGGISHQLRTDYIITRNLKANECKCSYFIEVACNTLFGAGKNSMIAPPDADKSYTISMLEITVFDRQVYDLLIDFELLHDLAKHLGDSNLRAYQALYTANHMINTLVLDSKTSYVKTHELATAFFNQHNGESQHTVAAIGNCHIDTAWLWPYGETIRKCGRSWSTAIRLIEDHPDMIFACSQAQQLFWVKEAYPSLFKEIQEFAAKGKFIPVGGTWVEMDGNIPSGESFIRQFLYGQEFFEKEFNKICHEFWLPDTFGYSAQLPQIMKLCGAEYFLSQKLSWNLVNKFPHNTFIWEGIDGTEVIAHFPPANTYSANINVQELLSTAANLNDKGRVSESMLLYGFGDGGGGPHEDMLERQKRLQDVDGCPKIRSCSPEEFFVRIKNKEIRNLNRWTGELYLELHNGTFTTQATTKLWNRKCEFALHDVDFLAAVWAMYSKSTDARKKEHAWIKEQLDTAWKSVLLNQFHDVLPGSSIKCVYDEAQVIYRQVMDSLDTVRLWLLNALFGDTKSNSATSVSEAVIVNTLPWQRTEVVNICSDFLDPTTSPQCQFVPVLVTVPPLGFTRIKDIKPATVTIEKLMDGCFKLANDCIEAKVDSLGRVVSLRIVGCDKEAIASECLGNQFVLYDDIPLYWDAWDVMDYHLETGKPILNATSHASLSPMKDEIIVEMAVGTQSNIKLTISLLPEQPYLTFKAKINWKENHKFLKVEFPVGVHSNAATFDIQFGHLQRPTHFNTSWDWAKYEVCGHKWVDLSEFDWGVALLNDSKYGHAVHRNIMRMSLLRSSKSPDDQADMGWHEIRYALMPHCGTLQQANIVKEAYSFNVPLITHYPKSEKSGFITDSLQTFFSVLHPSVVIETVKLAQENDRAFVIRMYEAFGGSCSTKLICRLPVKPKEIFACDGLERPIGPNMNWEDGGISLTFTPFKILSILIKW